ncbi:MAG: hypothetical protein SH819_13755 [Cytophagales bacterium]|nr:hypothetical protein [Cytophagales bacterium]
MANSGLSGLTVNEHLHIYREWNEILKSQMTPLELEMPWITLIARDYLSHFLEKRPKESVRVFEYGSGGSSLFFIRRAANVVSVEHDRLWFDKVKNHVAKMDEPGLSIHLIEPEYGGGDNVGDPSDPYAYATEDERLSKYSFRSYASFIDRFPDENFDVVLVDGRSRPACLYHSAGKVKRGGLLVLDNAERKYYLKSAIIDPKKFKRVSSSYGAIIGIPQLSQTNIYLRK